MPLPQLSGWQFVTLLAVCGALLIAGHVWAPGLDPLFAAVSTAVAGVSQVKKKDGAE